MGVLQALPAQRPAGRAGARLGALLRGLPPHQQAAAAALAPGAQARLAQAGARGGGPRHRGAGHLQGGHGQRGHHPRRRLHAAHHSLQAAAPQALHLRQRRQHVPLPPQGPRGPAPGRARHAALRPRQQPARRRHRDLQAPPRHPAVFGVPAVAELGPDRLGARARHAARADPRLPRVAQDRTQHRAPPHDANDGRLRQPHAHPEGGGLRARPRLHQRHGP
mmetsp:Transcript_16835/g.65787  ORF Transcript_16835/g.65787 Transcript_16835/m.65787 type:complete len:221 (+) Transcript_16835:2345-3007(+)